MIRNTLILFFLSSFLYSYNQERYSLVMNHIAEFGFTIAQKEQLNSMHKAVNANKNSKINQVIAKYISEHNSGIEETQESLKAKDNNGWLSKAINAILDLLKL